MSTYLSILLTSSISSFYYNVFRVCIGIVTYYILSSFLIFLLLDITSYASKAVVSICVR